METMEPPQVTITDSEYKVDPIQPPPSYQKEELENRKINKNNAHVKKPRNRPAKPAPTLLHDQLSAEMAEGITVDQSGLDPVKVVQRLFQQQDKSSLPQKQQNKKPNGNVVSSNTKTISRIESRLTGDHLHLIREHVREKTVEHIQEEADCISNSSKSSNSPAKPTKKTDGQTFTLNDFATLFALGDLIEKYGRISHMGILDPSYSFFLSQDRQAALYYKVMNTVAVVGGNPLCAVDRYDALLNEFSVFRKKHKFGIAFLGATDKFAQYSKEQKGWVSMQFGTERALNPLTNPILAEKEGKRIVKQNKQLLDPQRGGMRVNIYVPAQGQDLALQQRLMNVYETWRNNRNESGEAQAYMTVFDPFALPHLMIYIYTTHVDEKENQPNGFAALRRIDGSSGYHIDPYCALPDAPRGTTDLLIYSALALLNRANVPYLGLGWVPSEELTDIHNLSPRCHRITKACHRKTFQRLPISGKKAFHEKWRPDPNFDAGLYIVYPDGVPSLRHSLATLHFANISAKKILKDELKDQVAKFKNHSADTKEIIEPPDSTSTSGKSSFEN